MKKPKSDYAKRLATRKGAGTMRYTLPVDARGRATLNRRDMVKGQDGKLKTRSFERLARADEV